MSEYIEIEPELDDDNLTMRFYTNLKLTTETEELYRSHVEMEEGSPLAQALTVVEGIQYLEINTQDLVVRRHAEAEWLAIVEDVSAVLRDFFL